MAKFVVTTQGLENYGAHCEDGKFSSGNSYWKFKSGTDYIVEGLDRPQDAMAFVAAIGIENNIGWKEFPCDVKIYDEWIDAAYDEDHREFMLSCAKTVNPSTFQKEAA